jgi:glutamate/tyrosine decarboxylase-like PLP-dependent enzyme
LSRGARALKTWLTIRAFGADRLGEAIAGNCATARYLAQRLDDDPLFELKAPVALNIVCFGLRSPPCADANRQLVIDLHLSGVAAPSWTTVGGEVVIRCAIVNHRTTQADVDILLDALSEAAMTRAEASRVVAVPAV